MNALTIPGAKVLTCKQIVCRDRYHVHNSPIQNMLALDVNGHYVEVTQDGETFNARIDGGPARFNLTADQVNQFIQENTQ
ncbi:MAG: hypothetical protein HXY42_03745 [Chloroflexi bacterium]|nr:hypothetical protein [Chloroflexota bacterium]